MNTADVSQSVYYMPVSKVCVSLTYEGCSKSFANRYTENTQSIGI